MSCRNPKVSKILYCQQFWQHWIVSWFTPSKMFEPEGISGRAQNLMETWSFLPRLEAGHLCQPIGGEKSDLWPITAELCSLSGRACWHLGIRSVARDSDVLWVWVPSSSDVTGLDITNLTLSVYSQTGYRELMLFASWKMSGFVHFILIISTQLIWSSPNGIIT